MQAACINAGQVLCGTFMLSWAAGFEPIADTPARHPCRCPGHSQQGPGGPQGGRVQGHFKRDQGWQGQSPGVFYSTKSSYSKSLSGYITVRWLQDPCTALEQMLQGLHKQPLQHKEIVQTKEQHDAFSKAARIVQEQLDAIQRPATG